MSACESQELVSRTLRTFLESIRSDTCFNLFWEYIEKRRSTADVSTPNLPRLRKVPRRYEVGTSAVEPQPTVEDHYRRIYYESLDLVVTSRYQDSAAATQE